VPDAPSATPPRLLEEVPPEYPEQARAERLEAAVVLRLSIDEQGTVTGVELVEPAGHGFDEAARAAALAYRFAPAERAGKAIASRTLVRVLFAPPVEEAAPLVAAAAAPAAALSAAPPAPTAPAPAKPAPGAAVDVNVQGKLSKKQEMEQSEEAVQVVDLHRARQQTADLGEMLARTSGVTVRRDGGLGSAERIALNGMYDDDVRFFVDTFPLEISPFGLGVTSIPINVLKRIEIYRGVVPIRFASDALGGAINVVTDDEYTTHADAAYQIGSFGTHRFSANGRYRDANTGIFAGGSAWIDRTQNDYEVDVNVPDEKGRLSPATVRRFHDGYKAYGAVLNGGVTDRKWAKLLSLQGFYGRNDKEVQHNVVMTVPYGEVRWDSRVYGASAHYEVELPHGITPELSLGYSHRTVSFEDKSKWVYNWFGERIRERRVAGEIDVKPTDQVEWQHSLYGRAGAAWQIHPDHKLSLASGTQYNTRTGDERIQADPTARDPLTAERKLLRVVTGLEYQLKLWDDLLSNTLFVKDYHYRAKSEEPLPGGVFKKRDLTKHREGIGDGLRLRLTPWLLSKLSYELATKLPDPDQVFGDGMLIRPNLELEPETSHNANLGLGLELKRTRVGDFNGEVNGFWRNSDNLIVLLGNDRSFTYQNVYRARTLGVEGSTAWSAPKRYVGIDGTITYIDQRNASSEGTFGAFEGDRIPNRPYLMASWGAHLRFPGFPGDDDPIEPFYVGRYVHEFFRGWESQGLREFKQVVDAQVTHSAGVSWTWSESFGRTTTTVEVDNLTDAKAYDNFGVQRPGRAFYLKVEGYI
jgi:TonB family protein